jgi:hypothetical protein
MCPVKKMVVVCMRDFLPSGCLRLGRRVASRARRAFADRVLGSGLKGDRRHKVQHQRGRCQPSHLPPPNPGGKREDGCELDNREDKQQPLRKPEPVQIVPWPTPWTNGRSRQLVDYAKSYRATALPTPSARSAPASRTRILCRLREATTRALVGSIPIPKRSAAQRAPSIRYRCRKGAGHRMRRCRPRAG